MLGCVGGFLLGVILWFTKDKGDHVGTPWRPCSLNFVGHTINTTTHFKKHMVRSGKAVTHSESFSRALMALLDAAHLNEDPIAPIRDMDHASRHAEGVRVGFPARPSDKAICVLR